MGRDAMSEELTDLDEEEVAVLRCDKPSASVEAGDTPKAEPEARHGSSALKKTAPPQTKKKTLRRSTTD